MTTEVVSTARHLGIPMADNDDIPFNRDFPLKPGVVDEARPGVRRVLCNNPSPFTFTGTVSYIVGQRNVAIIDPGPDDAAHAAALLDAVRGETVSHILVTHTHRDHSPNTARIKQATAAPVYAEGPHRASRPRFVRFLIRHRKAREASILHRLAKGEADIPTMVRAIYIGIDPRLTTAAGYSVLAHLEDLVARRVVATDGDPVIGGTYRMA